MKAVFSWLNLAMASALLGLCFTTTACQQDDAVPPSTTTVTATTVTPSASAESGADKVPNKAARTPVHSGGTSPHGRSGKGTLPAGHPPVPGMAKASSAVPALPAGHPPIGAQAPAGMVADPTTRSMTGPVRVVGVQFPPPQGWLREAPKSRMRAAQFRLPGPEGVDAAEVSVIAAGGSVKGNIDRWKGQFQSPPKSEVHATKVDGISITSVTLEGTFILKSSPMAPGPGTPMPDFIVRALIIEAPGGTLFVKGWGPSATMKRWDKSFMALAESVRVAE